MQLCPKSAAMLLVAPCLFLGTAPACEAAPQSPAASRSDTGPQTRPQDPPHDIHPAAVDWIVFADDSQTPILDELSRALAAARNALAQQDRNAAALAVRSAAATLQAEGDKLYRLDSQQAADDLAQADATHTRLLRLADKLRDTAERISAGQLDSVAALDQAFDADDRASLEHRWLVSDPQTWFPAVAEPHRHLRAALEAFIQKDLAGSAEEIRKASAYIRLESRRASLASRSELIAAERELDGLAARLSRADAPSAQELQAAFARADHARANAFRAAAEQRWNQKRFEAAGHELMAAAQALEDATHWHDRTLQTAGRDTAGTLRSLGDKLAAGGLWSREEIAHGLEALGQMLMRLGERLEPVPEPEQPAPPQP